MSIRRKSEMIVPLWTREASFETEEVMTLRSELMHTFDDLRKVKAQRMTSFAASWLDVKRGRVKRMKRRYCLLRGSTLFCHRQPNERSLWYVSLVGAMVVPEPKENKLRIVKARAHVTLKFGDADLLLHWASLISRAGRKMSDVYGMMPTRLGSGGFSHVWLGYNKQSGEQVAVKVMNKNNCNSAEVECFKKEMYIMQEVNSPCCVEALDVFDTPDKLYIVQEFMEGGSIGTMMEKKLPPRLSERNVRSIARDLFEAVSYLHAIGILHRDIKPDNLLYQVERTPQRVKLADFGFATWLTDGHVTSPIIGTPNYLAPEMLQRKPYNGSVDVWACGVTIFKLFMGFGPFDGDNLFDTMKNVRDNNGNFNGRRWDEASPLLRSFVRALLNPDTDKRLTARAALCHPFLARVLLSDESRRRHGDSITVALSASRTGSSDFGRPHHTLRGLAIFVLAIERLRHLVFTIPEPASPRSPRMVNVFKSVATGLRPLKKNSTGHRLGIERKSRYEFDL